LELFEKQGFGFVARDNGVHRTSVSKGSPQYNIPPPNFYAPYGFGSIKFWRVLCGFPAVFPLV
jgi:hypothetical protein